VVRINGGAVRVSVEEDPSIPTATTARETDASASQRDAALELVLDGVEAQLRRP
jgi:hypothetical protein